jgi:hypothetical protein
MFHAHWNHSERIATNKVRSHYLLQETGAQRVHDFLHTSTPCRVQDAPRHLWALQVWLGPAEFDLVISTRKTALQCILL